MCTRSSGGLLARSPHNKGCFKGSYCRMNAMKSKLKKIFIMSFLASGAVGLFFYQIVNLFARISGVNPSCGSISASDCIEAAGPTAVASADILLGLCLLILITSSAWLGLRWIRNRHHP